MQDLKEYMRRAVGYYVAGNRERREAPLPFSLTPLTGNDEEAYRATVNKCRQFCRTCGNRVQAAELELQVFCRSSVRFSMVGPQLRGFRFDLKALNVLEYLLENGRGSRRLLYIKYAELMCSEAFRAMGGIRGKAGVRRVFEQSAHRLTDWQFRPFAAFRAWAPHGEASPIDADLAAKILRAWTEVEGGLLSLDEQVWEYRQEEQMLLVVGHFGSNRTMDFTGLTEMLQSRLNLTPFGRRRFDFRVRELLYAELRGFAEAAREVFSLGAGSGLSAELENRLKTLMHHAEMLSTLERYRDDDPRGPKGPVASTLPVPGAN